MTFLLLLALQNDFTSAEHGFRISRPGDGWTFTPGSASDDFIYSLKVTARDAEVTVYVLDVEGYKTGKEARDLTEARRRSEKWVTNLARGDDAIGPWLRFDSSGYNARQHFLVHHNTLYVIQAAARRFDDHAKDFDAIAKSFAPIAPSDAKKHATQQHVRKLARRCGTQLEWATDWASAAKRAADEKKLVLVVVELYRGFDFPRMAPAATFMDTDIIELVKERFVPLAWTPAMEAPFEKPDVYGMGSSTFGQGVLFVNPEGRVVGEGVSLNPTYLYDAARALFPELRPPRRELEKARNDLERGTILVRLARYAEAEKLLRGTASPEGRFWLAIARGMRLGIEPIREELEALAQEHPDSPWAWRGAALLVGQGMASGLDRAPWPDEKELDLCRTVPHEPIADAARAMREARDFLVASQLEDGAWTNSMSLSNPRGASTLAVTAIAGAALLAERPKEAERALALCLQGDYASDSERVFDYAIWARIFVLRFLAKAGGKRAVNVMNAIVRGLRADQHKSGGWSYVNVAGREDNSISFVTAATILALRDAKAAGADVPDALIDSAVKLVASVRHENGSFGYMPLTGKGEPARIAEASLRSPLCALAIGDREGVRTALDIWMKQRAHVRRERGKGLCHTAPEGTASYYLLYGYAFMSEALALLPADERAGYRDAIREDVLFMRTKDGAFCDNPGIGRAYGAGMALQTLRRLAD